MAVVMMSTCSWCQSTKLVRQEKGVSLYEKWILSQKGEKVRELSALFTIAAPCSRIVQLLCDAKRGLEWNGNARSFSILTLEPQKRWITYIRYAVPWPLDDQDCCLLYKVTESKPGRSTEIHFESMEHHRFPVPNKTTRITGTKGFWKLQEQPSGSLQVTYTVTTDRSATLPRWISDPIVYGNLFETMTAFKKIAETK